MPRRKFRLFTPQASRSPLRARHDSLLVSAATTQRSIDACEAGPNKTA
jgi:hypothetical protein